MTTDPPTSASDGQQDRIPTTAAQRAAWRAMPPIYRRRRRGWTCTGPNGCGATVRDLPGHSHYKHPATHQFKYCSMPHPAAVKPAFQGGRHAW